MFLEGILAISGQPGLFKLVSKGSNSVIVESLLTGKKMPAFSTSRISTLDDVTVYTYDNDTPLKKIFISIFEKYNGQTQITSKSSNTDLIAFVEEILPNYDKDKVYVSDMKKMVSWYNLLVEKEIITEESVKAEKEELSKSKEENQAE